MYALVATPPVVFIILWLFISSLSYLASFLAVKPNQKTRALNQAYASGEDIKTHRVQPDYRQFFPFAFFFTILHVVTMVVGTTPTDSLGSFIIAIIYIAGVMLGLFILFRR
jgi:NADH-quinone oxidoreductase subunit A